MSSIVATRAAARSGGDAFLSQILFAAKGPFTQSGPIALAADARRRPGSTARGSGGRIVGTRVARRCSTSPYRRKVSPFMLPPTVATMQRQGIAFLGDLAVSSSTPLVDAIS